jgi:para-aminobenzoate synthetase component I
VRKLNISSGDLVKILLSLPKQHKTCFLDSCGINHLGSHFLICGINPVNVLEIKDSNPKNVLDILDQTISQKGLASIFTLSYDFGLKLERIQSRFTESIEPDLFIASFDTLIIHDYDTLETRLEGNEKNFDEIENILREASIFIDKSNETSHVTSNFDRKTYINKVNQIKESVRNGDTYQVNLTQQLSAELPKTLTPELIYKRLRKNNPTPFSAFLRRENDIVISTSPERFFEVKNGRISVSPIKGTRPRGIDKLQDEILRNELLASEKDYAENVMIVDLMRNDIGRICDFGSVNVDKLCNLEVHPSLFHLVSTVSGNLRENIKFSEIIRALLPCGSITGCPKIRTMQIIDEIETVPRGLSMGAVGYSNFNGDIDLSVAIRTMVVRGNIATFNVGGGIVIDSVPELEYEESLTKAKALLDAINSDFSENNSHKFA